MPISPPAAAVIAHRGASAYRAEHTWEAYDCALAMSADRLELDVRAMADGTLLVLHDATLARTAGDPRAVRALTRRDLRALERPPLTLDEVLGRYGGAARYLVEVKDPSPRDLPLLLEVLARHEVSGRVCVQSFDRAGLLRLRALDARLPLALLYRPTCTSAGVRRDLPRVANWVSGIAPAASTVDAALVHAAHGAGLAVQAYTVNEEAEMQRLLALGIDGLITDVPDRARALLDAVPLPNGLRAPSQGRRATFGLHRATA